MITLSLNETSPAQKQGLLMEALLHFSLYFTQTNTGGMLPCACRLMVIL
jgi:hypothetical protein